MPRLPGPDGRDRIVLAVDVSNWLRPDATTSPERSFCHAYPRGRGHAQMIRAGDTYGSPHLSGYDLLDRTARDPPTAPRRRRNHGDCQPARTVFERLHNAGHWKMGDPDLLVVMDSGYDVTRLTWLLKDLPVTLVARVRSSRVFYAPARKRKGRPRAVAHVAAIAHPGRSRVMAEAHRDHDEQTTNYGRDRDRVRPPAPAPRMPRPLGRPPR
ncbi:MAG: transposase [Tessaracoccus sp.]